MTILKDKYGREVADTKDFENKGFGEFGKHIRATVDSDWGKVSNDDENIKHYRVSYTATADVEGVVEVWAHDELEAEDLADQEDVSWEIKWDGDINDPEIDEIEEIGEDDE